MPEDICPVQWTGRQAVVTLPQDIDISNADLVRSPLAAAAGCTGACRASQESLGVAAAARGANGTCSAFRRGRYRCAARPAC